MKFKHFSFSALLCAAALISLPSCSEMDEPGTGIPIRMNVAVDSSEGSLISKDNPFHVVAYARDKKCESYYYLFESDGYIDASGKLKWIGGNHEWPGVYVKFVAYFPANADVVLSDTGEIINATCSLFAISDPVCHLSENVTLTFFPYTFKN